MTPIFFFYSGVATFVLYFFILKIFVVTVEYRYITQSKFINSLFFQFLHNLLCLPPGQNNNLA